VLQILSIYINILPQKPNIVKYKKADSQIVFCGSNFSKLFLGAISGIAPI